MDPGAGQKTPSARPECEQRRHYCRGSKPNHFCGTSQGKHTEASIEKDCEASQTDLIRRFVELGAEGEGTEMHQVNARHEIIREWRSLPKELRQTDEQAAAFAMQIKDKYKFSSDSADPYQTVKGWLLCYLSLTRGME